MKPEYAQEKARVMGLDYKRAVKKLEEDCKSFEGLDAVIPHGVYKGRWGKVESPQFSRGQVIAMMRPYSLWPNDDYRRLWDSADAKTWPLEDVTEFRKSKE